MGVTLELNEMLFFVVRWDHNDLRHRYYQSFLTKSEAPSLFLREHNATQMYDY
jgi:hypothetical protein